MGFFDKVFKGVENIKDEMNNYTERIDAYRNILKMIDVNGVTAERLEKCFADPKAYYDEYAENYDNRWTKRDADNDTIIWLGMLDALEDNDLIVEFDWKVELEDFIYGLGFIRNDAVPLEESWFDEDGEFTEWAALINEKWEAIGYVLADFCISSDSYCSFITTKETFDKLAAEAKKAGQKIELAHKV